MRALALLVTLGLSAPAADSLAVVFVGNSHTYVNNVPLLVESLALSGGRSCPARQSTFGGYTLDDHTRTQPTLDSIARGGWDWVVLQEQSQVPSIAWCRDSLMFPAARLLDSAIAGAGCSTAFYLTWGWRDGGVMTFGGHSSPPFRDYFEMQDSVAASHATIAAELGARLCPVGLAWAEARRLVPGIELWQSDACHATLQGSYLAACVFYAELFAADPTGLDFTAGLAYPDALFLQEVAWSVVSGVAEPVPPGTEPSILAVAPNPARTRAVVRLAAPCAMVDLLDPAGRRLRSLAVRGGAVSLDVSGLAPGVYFVRAGPASLRADLPAPTQAGTHRQARARLVVVR